MFAWIFCSVIGRFVRVNMIDVSRDYRARVTTDES